MLVADAHEIALYFHVIARKAKRWVMSRNALISDMFYFRDLKSRPSPDARRYAMRVNNIVSFLKCSASVSGNPGKYWKLEQAETPVMTVIAGPQSRLIIVSRESQYLPRPTTSTSGPYLAFTLFRTRFYYQCCCSPGIHMASLVGNVNHIESLIKLWVNLKWAALD